jgi:tol-pal system protein YbgF
MKKVAFHSLLLLGLSSFLVQCATTKDMEYTNIKMRNMDTKVATIDQEVAELKQQTVSQVRARQAETGERLDFHQSEIARLQSLIEENNYYIRQVQEENKELKQILESRLDTLSKDASEEISRLHRKIAQTDDHIVKASERVALTEAQIDSIRDARSREAEQRAREAAQRAREAERKARKASSDETKTVQVIYPEQSKIDVSEHDIPIDTEEMEEKTLPPTPTPPPPPPVKTAAVKTKYDQGMSLYKNKKYQQAYTAFIEYLDANTSGSQAVNARYYAAESLYQQEEYELAILEFQKVIVEHPQHGKVPVSLFKQGLCFEKLGDKETARIVYNKLLDNYPTSDQVQSAQKRLNNL